MANEFKLKAKRYEEMLAAPQQAEAGVATEEVPAAWVEAYRKEGVLPEAVATPKPPPPLPTVALMVMKADATSKDATFTEALVDRTVQIGQPYPAVTHVELWIGDQPGDKHEDNHFSTYLGTKRGALWTSGLTDSKKFYSSAAWSAVPLVATDVERRVRAECNLHSGTPYPPAALLWQYPMSIWPLRAFSGLMDDRINAPAHCAALSARILRSALPEVDLPQPSHWYGPSSLYLELSKPERMEQALAALRPVVRAKVEEERDEALADALTLHSDEEVVGMSRDDARQALLALSVQVLRAGSRQGGVEVDQDAFREAQERYARGLTRYTWLNRKVNER
jgi:hypothetical protein